MGDVSFDLKNKKYTFILGTYGTYNTYYYKLKLNIMI